MAHGSALTTSAVKRKVPFPIVSKALGHTDLSTLTHYLEISDADVFAAFEAADRPQIAHSEGSATG